MKTIETGNRFRKDFARWIKGTPLEAGSQRGQASIYRFHGPDGVMLGLSTVHDSRPIKPHERNRLIAKSPVAPEIVIDREEQLAPRQDEDSVAAFHP